MKQNLQIKISKLSCVNLVQRKINITNEEQLNVKVKHSKHEDKKSL